MLKILALLLGISLLPSISHAQDYNDQQFQQQRQYEQEQQQRQEQQATKQREEEQAEEDRHMRENGYYPRAQLEGAGGYATGCRNGGGC